MRSGGTHEWIAVQELYLCYHNPETTLFTTYPYYGNLNQVGEPFEPDPGGLRLVERTSPGQSYHISYRGFWGSFKGIIYHMGSLGFL